MDFLLNIGGGKYCMNQRIKLPKWIFVLFVFMMAIQLHSTKGEASPLIIENLKVDKTSLSLEDSLTWSIKLNSPAKNISVKYVPEKWEGIYFPFTIGATNENGEASSTFTIPLEMSKGTWIIKEIIVETDTSTEVIKNSALVQDENAMDLSAGNFTVVPSEKPMLKSLTVDKNEGTTGDRFIFKSRVEDGTGNCGIKEEIVYRDPLNNRYTLVFWGNQYCRSGDTYRFQTAQFDISPLTEPGLWKVDHITVIDDIHQTSLTINNSAFYEGQDTSDLSYLNLQINRKTGWIWWYQGSRYYIDPVTGQVKTGLFQDNGYTYFFHDDGKMAIDEWVEINGKSYYFAKWGPEQGMEGTMAKYGWTYIGDDLYYFLSDGQTISAGWKKIDSKWYFFDDRGVAQRGWFTSGGKKYYLNCDMVVGLRQIDGHWYYFNKDGTFGSEFKEGWNLGEGKWYYMNNGKLIVNTLKKIKGADYLFDRNGVMVAAAWVKLEDIWYYFNDNGSMRKSSWLYSGKAWYYLDGTGAMKTGWLKLGTTWYYLDRTGAMGTGWKFVGTKWYYFLSSGKMVTGWQSINGKKYLFDYTGAWIK
jgi:glucan-binding YG repeat protein